MDPMKWITPLILSYLSKIESPRLETFRMLPFDVLSLAVHGDSLEEIDDGLALLSTLRRVELATFPRTGWDPRKVALVEGALKTCRAKGLLSFEILDKARPLSSISFPR